MGIKSFETLVRSESRARLFFVKLCWKNYRRFCIRCRSYKVYRLAGKRYRCSKCRYTFTDFTGRWINRVRISYKKWLWILKLFELEISARKIAQQVELSYPTVLRAVHLIRMAIVSADRGAEDLLEGEVEMDETYFGGKRKGRRGRGARNKVPVFGILERNGIVRVDVLKDVTAESILSLTIKIVRRGSIVYTDKFKSYDSLMFCGYRHLKVDHSRRFSTGRVYINGLEGFWSYAKERLIKHHGVSKEKFPLYLKEMEFRYNNRDKNIFNLLAKNICNLVPDHL